jgi:lipopolysaccharide transport system ATP-binding protein
LPDTAVRFDSVSKRFQLTLNRPQTVQEVFQRLIGVRPQQLMDSFWAVRDVDLEVSRGETVGIVGANGAGKSTLLKLACRIIAPTTGQIGTHGRVAALLEVGTGFHPDLTGRENIHLNGSMLGMTRTEIRREMDDIIGFAELEEQIDMPVKHYSSGMYMRLGFSIASHVRPEILLIDEVLAVGDRVFQQKCQRRVERMAEAGVTILFVSHDSRAVRSVCQRAVWMEEGRVRTDGPADEVVDAYGRHVAAQMGSSAQENVAAVHSC